MLCYTDILVLLRKTLYARCPESSVQFVLDGVLVTESEVFAEKYQTVNCLRARRERLVRKDRRTIFP